MGGASLRGNVRSYTEAGQTMRVPARRLPALPIQLCPLEKVAVVDITSVGTVFG